MTHPSDVKEENVALWEVVPELLRSNTMKEFELSTPPSEFPATEPDEPEEKPALVVVQPEKPMKACTMAYFGVKGHPVTVRSPVAERVTAVP